MKEYVFGNKWVIAIPGNLKKALHYSVEKWIEVANNAVADHGFFSVALSGGTTPLPLYQELTSSHNKNKLPWDQIYLFWSDERSVHEAHKESNYRMAVIDGGFGNLVPSKNIFRMVAEKDIEANALQYEEIIKTTLKNRPFDMTMLGLGDDGHTASLFPHTKALHVQKRLVVANFVPAQDTMRMTFTFDAINQSKNIFIHVFGASKASILEKVLATNYTPDEFPIQRVGTPQNKATFFLDEEAGKKLSTAINI